MVLPAGQGLVEVLTTSISGGLTVTFAAGGGETRLVLSALTAVAGNVTVLGACHACTVQLAVLTSAVFVVQRSAAAVTVAGLIVANGVETAGGADLGVLRLPHLEVLSQQAVLTGGCRTATCVYLPKLTSVAGGTIVDAAPNTRVRVVVGLPDARR